MSSREEILSAVRSNLPRLDRPLPDIPKFERADQIPLVEQFGRSLVRMGGRLLAAGPLDDPLAPVRDLLKGSRRVCSATPEIEGCDQILASAAAVALADVDHAIVRARCGVAETGSVLLTDTDLGVNVLAFLAQHLIVLLDPAEIVADMHEAYRRPEFRDNRYAVFHSGPSATADIEGVLIHGAQGVRSVWVMLAGRVL